MPKAESNACAFSKCAWCEKEYGEVFERQIKKERITK